MGHHQCVSQLQLGCRGHSLTTHIAGFAGPKAATFSHCKQGGPWWPAAAGLWALCEPSASGQPFGFAATAVMGHGGASGAGAAPKLPIPS